MVKGVQPSCVRPRVLGWVETLLCGRVGVYFTNEGKGAVEVRVPGDGANSQEGRGGQGRARVGEGLRTAPSDSVQSKSIRTTTGSYLERGRGGGGGGGKTDTLFESLARHRGRAARGRTGRERAALKDVERTPLRAATCFRAPAGSLASILGMSTSRSTTTRVFERASCPPSRASHSSHPGIPGASSRQITAFPFVGAPRPGLGQAHSALGRGAPGHAGARRASWRSDQGMATGAHSSVHLSLLSCRFR